MSRVWPSSWLLAVLLPVLVIAVILVADAIEGPKTAFVGVLAVVPMLAAVFGTPVSVLGVGAVTWLSAFVFGLTSSDGNVPAQVVRLVIIVIVSVLAAAVALIRQGREARLAAAELAMAQARQLASLAEIDQLTGIANRRGVERAANEVLQAPERTVALVDVDRLKQVNDQHGHLVGDEYIKAAAMRIKGSVSSTDAVGRWGGDEFLLVLDLPFDRSASVLERMHAAVTAGPVATAGLDLPLSISIGAAPWPAGTAFDDALRKADQALYEAKKAGRSRISYAP